MQAGQYQVRGCSVVVTVSSEGGDEAEQRLVAAACRTVLGPHLASLAAAATPPAAPGSAAGPAAEDPLVAAEPPARRPRLRSPGRVVPPRTRAGQTVVNEQPQLNEAAWDLGFDVMQTVMERHPLTPPAFTLVREYRYAGIGCLAWRFDNESEAHAFRAGVMTAAARSGKRCAGMSQAAMADLGFATPPLAALDAAAMETRAATAAAAALPETRALSDTLPEM